MLAILGFLPVFGPIISGILEYLNKKEDRELAKYQVDAQGQREAVQAANALTLGFIGDIGVKVARDIVMWPMAIWYALGTWDKIVGIHYPDWVWNVDAFPTHGGLEYLPMAFLGFIFGLSWKAMK